MSEEIKLVELTEKPKWFDMVDYKAIDKFDISSWTFNLCMRMYFYKLPNFIIFSDLPKDEVDNIMNSEEGAALMISQTLNKLLHKEYGFKPSYSVAINFRTSQDLFWDFETMDKEFQTHFLGEFYNHLKRDYPLRKQPDGSEYRNCFWDFCDTDSKYFNDEYKIFDNSFMINAGNTEHPSIKINTNLPKKRIMKDFEKWLDEYKKQNKSNSKPFSLNEHRKLCENRYLQIIDLLNHARIKHSYITNANLMSWVFPDKIMDTSRITQLKKEINDTILTPNYTNWLESQVE